MKFLLTNTALAIENVLLKGNIEGLRNDFRTLQYPLAHGVAKTGDFVSQLKDTC